MAVSERQTRWLLVVLLLGQTLLVTAQVREPGRRESVLETGVLRVVAPLATAVAAVAEGVRGIGREIRLNRSLLEENRRLRGEVDRLRQERIQHFGLEGDLRRLAEAVRYERTQGRPILPADIVYIDHSSWLQTAIVRVSTSGGRVNVDQPVVSSEGLVGRVVGASGAYAKVQLITDRSASVGAMIERTRRQGVVFGTGRGPLRLDYVSLQADVRVGDVVQTAGIDGVYPRGLPVGTVVAVAPGDDLFHRIEVVPLVDFGVLDQVFVLVVEALPKDYEVEAADARP